MKTSSKIIAVAFVLMMIALPFAAVGESSGESINPKINVTKSFTDNDDGTIEVKLTGLQVGKDYIIAAQGMSATKLTDGTYGKTEFEAKSSEQTVSISWRFDSSGHHTVMIALYEKGIDTPIDQEGGVGIDVSHSIWKDWTTYVAIIIVVILIIVAAYLKLRGGIGSGSSVMKKSKKFTELEASNSAASTEKKMFFSNRQQQPAEAPKDIPKEEPKAPVVDNTSTEKQTYSPGRGFFKNRKQ